MKLVTDASPLIFLAKIDGLALLEGCFAEVLVPPAVVAEARLRLPDFIRRTELSELGEAFVRGAVGALHRGELEAIVLARETTADLVALDDRGARVRARQLGVMPIGTVGLLLLGHRRGLIDAARAARQIDALVQDHGLYLSVSVLQRVHTELKQGNEQLLG
ncbi:MAG: DUF3368 domain-containing protein [Chromatiaceae bacterium]|nr:DUF3368 domain-containing protein [Chromatiaceae bacterium]